MTGLVGNQRSAHPVYNLKQPAIRNLQAYNDCYNTAMMPNAQQNDTLGSLIKPFRNQATTHNL